MTLATNQPQSALAPGSTPTLEDGWLLYLYGILEAGSDAHRLLNAGAIGGIDPTQPAFAVSVANLVAAVSRVPSETFEELPLNELAQDLTRLAPLAVRHEEVVGRLARRAPALVPMTFGAVYRSVGGVVRLLHERAAEFAQILDQVRGCQEWGVRVFANQERLIAALVAESKAVQSIDAEIASSTPGRAYLLRRQRGHVIATELERLLDDSLSQLAQALEMHTKATRTDRPEVTAASNLVLNVSLLVPEEVAGLVREQVAALAVAYEPRGLRLEISGPWAPYAFVRGAHGAA